MRVAPSLSKIMFAALNQPRDEGSTMVVVDQMADLTIALADRCIVPGNGHIVHAGAAAAMRDIDALGSLYLADAPPERRQQRGAA